MSLRARLQGQTKLQETMTDRHPAITIELAAGNNTARVPFADDFGLVIPADLPALGSTSRNLKIVREEWSSDRKQLGLVLNGLGNMTYALKAYGSKIASADGGKVIPGSDGSQTIEVSFPADTSHPGYQTQNLRLNFTER